MSTSARADLCPNSECTGRIVWNDYPGRMSGAPCDGATTHYHEIEQLRAIAAGQRLNTPAALNGSKGGALSGAVLLSEVKPEQVQWMWLGRIPLGKITMIDGRPDLGKSTVTLDLAARVTRGHTMPDGSHSDIGGPAGVVILTAEDGLADTIRPRFDAAGGDPERVLALQAIISMQTDDDGKTYPVARMPTLADLEDLERGVRQVGARLVLIDPFMAYLPGRVHSYRDQDVRSILAPLAQLAERLGVAVVMVRHLNKGSDPDPINRGGGSIGIIGAARSGLLVARDPDDPEDRRRILARVKGNLAAPVFALAYHIEVNPEGVPYIEWEGTTAHDAFTLLAAPASDREDRPALDEAISFLKQLLAAGPRSAREMDRERKEAGIAEITLRRARTKLGVVSHKSSFTGMWVWELPPKVLIQGEDAHPENMSLFDSDEHLREPVHH